MQERVKLLLFADDIILYTEYLKSFTRKLLELKKEVNKVTGHKINKQKSIAFLYTNNKQQKEKLRNQSHLQLLKNQRGERPVL